MLEETLRKAVRSTINHFQATNLPRQERNNHLTQLFGSLILRLVSFTYFTRVYVQKSKEKRINESLRSFNDHSLEGPRQKSD